MAPCSGVQAEIQPKPVNLFFCSCLTRPLCSQRADGSVHSVEKHAEQDVWSTHGVSARAIVCSRACNMARQVVCARSSSKNLEVSGHLSEEQSVPVLRRHTFSHTRRKTFCGTAQQVTPSRCHRATPHFQPTSRCHRAAATCIASPLQWACSSAACFRACGAPASTVFSFWGWTLLAKRPSCTAYKYVPARATHALTSRSAATAQSTVCCQQYTCALV